MREILVYGVKEKSVLNNEVDKHIEDISIKGYTVVEDVIPSSELLTLSNSLDNIYLQQIVEIGESENLKKINDEFIVRLPLAYDKIFLDLAINKKILDIIALLLGDYYTLMLQNGIINKPSEFNYQASWHRDLNYQHFVSSRPLSISVLFCIDNFTKENGGTYFLPNTHKVEKFPSENYIIENEITIEVKAGSALVFDSMLYHRAGHNSSENIRRGINNMYTLPFVKQQIDIPNTLGSSFTNDNFLLKFLGYESQSGKNVTSWRQNKLKK